MMDTVIGIDPSLTATGYAHTDGSLNTISCVLKGDDRLLYIFDRLRMVIKTERPNYAVIEGMAVNGHSVGLLGMPQGVARLALMQHHVPYISVPPATLKKFATGRGNATKADMRMELYKRAGVDVRDDNQSDAWWLRELGLHALGQQTIELPATHLEALTKVKPWEAA